ncbi:MAG: ChbG/HpnK family deacetylase [Acidobacteria bacterium]|nr:ChbG/HpnK family deacetylase [Acidobacteriota bacterium]
MKKCLIFNADDFGVSVGVNRGILECHTRGVVTSASLMVTGRAVQEAVSISRDHPALAVGLHWDVWGEDEREFDIYNLPAVRDEFCRQLDEFHRLLGRMPTHVDSHRHAHRERKVMPVFRELVQPLGVPLRGDGRVRFVGGFYAQWEWMVTNLDYVSVPFLQRMLREEVAEGWTEFSCHPGYPSPDYTAVYLKERDTEVQTLTDGRIRQTIEEMRISLVSYSNYKNSFTS